MSEKSTKKTTTPSKGTSATSSQESTSSTQDQGSGSPHFTRSQKDKILAGVAGGLGDYFDLDPAIFRILFLLLTIFGGSGAIIYLVLWVIMPQSSRGSQAPRATIEENVEEIKLKAQDMAQEVRSLPRPQNPRMVWGLALLGLGAYFLLQNLGIITQINLIKFWPVLLIALGLNIVLKE